MLLIREKWTGQRQEITLVLGKEAFSDVTNPKNKERENNLITETLRQLHSICDALLAKIETKEMLPDLVARLKDYSDKAAAKIAALKIL